MQFDSNLEEGVKDQWKVSTIMRNVIPLLLFLTFLELGAGYVLEGLKETFVENPSLLVLVPPLKDLAGNFGSVLSSRVSTRLHLGLKSGRDKMFSGKAISDSLGTLMLVVAMSFLLSIMTYFFGQFGGSSLPFLQILKVTMLTSLILGVFVILISVSIVFLSFRRSIEPDDVAIPVVTNFADIVGVIVFALVVAVVV